MMIYIRRCKKVHYNVRVRGITIFILLIAIFVKIVRLIRCTVNLNEYVPICTGFKDVNIEARLKISSLDILPIDVTSEESLPNHGQFRIQRIIHQTWKNRTIPGSFQPWMRSFWKNHPDWEYHFWTDEASKKIIQETHSYLLPYFGNYSKPIFRADAIRYVLLYEFGGVYADIDMKSLRPLDPFIRKYSCFIGQEPHEHPIIQSNFDGLACNAFMACKKGHPFMKQLIESLPSFYHFPNMLAATGPHFVTVNYRNYIAANPNIDYMGEYGVYLTPPEYFFPSLDSVKFKIFHNVCRNVNTLSKLQQWACDSLKRRGYDRTPYAFSFTQHMYYHTYVRIDETKPVDILELIPAVILG
ncbi:hypothetical protein CHS0354_041039 [Potamilus streckersoni]|uniref:Uncharacterized protein n=1 Tax=Potamilus streckersoni TaxID=2493646 RepID=A0AAE0SE49_9BIVA|nr:hypothetical protein CHS0354_041039 [Potamilus streckersoni]